jgi:hypothetical protein
MTKGKKWRTRTRGTKRQKGLHFVIDGTSTQTKKLRLPRVNPRDINVNVTVTMSKEMRERKRKAESERMQKKGEEAPIGILDPRTHPLQVHKIEERISTPLRAPEGIGKEHVAEGVHQEVTVSGAREPSAMEETGKLAETISGTLEKRAERAKERRAEKREEKRYQEEKAERANEKAKKEREEALKREEKWKKEQEEKKKTEEKEQLKKVKWIKRAEKKTYAKEALKVADKQKK